MPMIRDPKADWSGQVAEEPRREDEIYWRNRASEGGEDEILTSRHRQAILWVVIALVLLSAISLAVVLTAGARS